MKDKTFADWIKNQNAALWFGVFYLAYSLFFFVVSFNYQFHSKYGPGPGMYPRWLSGISIVVAIVYIIQSITKNIYRIGEKFPPAKEIINVFIVFVSCIIFMLLLNVLGFNVAGSLLLFTVFMRQFKLWKAAILAVVITVVCYFIFKVLFAVPLPQNIFGF